MLVELFDYTLRVLPGLALIAACFLLARSEQDPMLRILVLILGFVLIRDAMTPEGLWRIGAEGGVPWLRFADDPGLLVILGTATLAATGALVWFAPGLRALVRWGRFDLPTIALGVGGGILAAGPILCLSGTSPVEARGGAVMVSVLPAVLFMAMAGNLGEEVLFRGFLQGRLEQSLSPVRAAVLSGTLFAACHAFLASTLTDVGLPLLLFTLYEGLICAFLRMRRGVIPAACAHGLAIFLLASGVV